MKGERDVVSNEEKNEDADEACEGVTLSSKLCDEGNRTSSCKNLLKRGNWALMAPTTFRLKG